MPGILKRAKAKAVGAPKKSEKATASSPTHKLVSPAPTKSFLTDKASNISKLGLKGKNGSGYFPPVTMLSRSERLYLVIMNKGKIIENKTKQMRINLKLFIFVCTAVLWLTSAKHSYELMFLPHQIFSHHLSDKGENKSSDTDQNNQAQCHRSG